MYLIETCVISYRYLLNLMSFADSLKDHLNDVRQSTPLYVQGLAAVGALALSSWSLNKLSEWYKYIVRPSKDLYK